MKLNNVMRIYRQSYFGDNYFYTILMDYSLWKVCYSGEFNLAQNYTEPESLENIVEAELMKLHNAISEIDSWIEAFFRHEDVSKWRKAEDVIPKEKMKMIHNGSSIGLIWKKGSTIKEFVYEENVYPESIPFPEFKKLQNLIDHLYGLRMKY